MAEAIPGQFGVTQRVEDIGEMRGWNYHEYLYLKRARIQEKSN